MPAFRTLGLVVGGVVIGVGMMLAGTRLGAQATAQTATPRADTPSSRIVMGPFESAGHYTFGFFLDTATGTCYLAGIGSAKDVTAITPTVTTACTKTR